LATTQHILLAQYGADGPVAHHTGWLDYAAPPAPPLATLGPFVLEGAEVLGCGTADMRTHLVLRPSTAEISPTLALFVQVLGGDGVLLGQADGAPLGLPPYRYHITPQLAVHDVRTVALPAGGQGAAVLVGAYDYATGERLAAVDSGGAAVPDNAWRLSCAHLE
jgi:hypothetical protein